MASRRSQIVDAIVTALDGAGKPVGLTVYRTRADALKAANLPAVVVSRVQEEAHRGDGPRGYKARRSLSIRVDCYVSTTTDGETSEDALDPLTSWAVQAVMADPTLGGLANNTNEVATQWSVSDTDAVYAHALVGFAVDYITAAGNPDAA